MSKATFNNARIYIIHVFEKKWTLAKKRVESRKNKNQTREKLLLQNDFKQDYRSEIAKLFHIFIIK